MSEIEVSFTSLCYIAEDYDGRMWLQRLADIEGGTLHTPFKSRRAGNYFENRDRLYRNDGPSALGTVGVWEWTAIPNRDNPEIDYVQSYYRKNYIPIRIVVLAASSLAEVVDQLKNGTARAKAYFCDTLFCHESERGSISGVLCHSKEFKTVGNNVILTDDVYHLPCYTVQIADVYNWEEPNLRFLRALHLDEPSEYILIKSADEIIRTVILDRSTRDIIKECFNVSNAQWRKCKTLLERVCVESLYEEVAQKLKCTLEQAKQEVDIFVERASDLIESGDIDSDVLSRISMNHSGLRKKCEEIVLRKWEEVNAAKIAEAEQHVADAEKQRNDLLSEIATAQSRHDYLRAEIKRYEALGEDTIAAVRKKISGAQKDMAGFISDISIFLPQSSTPFSHENRLASWQYTSGSESQYVDSDIDPAESWANEFDAIHQNLSHVLNCEPEFCTMLTAFLYSTHINNVPVLIAGPGGRDIAKALSVSMYACDAGQLTLGNGDNLNVIEAVKESGEHVISIQNMFGKSWEDIFPQTFGELKKHVIWTHPYAEDLVVEPKGLYNYMLPILSECFIGELSSSGLWPGKRTSNFQRFISQERQPLRISAFNHLKISKLLLNKLTHILSDAKTILDNPAQDKNMEILFGILPLCVLTGRHDVLENVIESENGISNSVRAEAARYIREE